MHIPQSSLLVSRSRPLRDRFRTLLESHSVEVCCVRRSDTALTLLEARSLGGPRRQFGLVVVERNTSPVPAVSLLDELRGTPHLSSIPVIILADVVTDVDRAIMQRARNCRILSCRAHNAAFLAELAALVDRT